MGGAKSLVGGAKSKVSRANCVLGWVKSVVAVLKLQQVGLWSVGWFKGLVGGAKSKAGGVQVCASVCS